MKQAFLAVSLTLIAAGPTPAVPLRCTHETVAIRSTPVTVSLCIANESVSSSVTTVALQSTYASKDGSFDQHASVRFIMGEGPARALQSVDLAPLGMNGVLHMTLLYSGNEVTMEHALLTPGAITIK
jgi:hypothetical protein